MSTILLITVNLVLIALLTACLVRLYKLQLRLQKAEQQNNRNEHRLSQMTTIDTLTRLPNHTALLEQLRMLLRLANRNRQTPALLYIDLDHFTELSERLGAELSNMLLTQIVDRLRCTLRESDLLGRSGDNSFLLITAHSTEDGCSNLAIKLMSQFEQPFRLGKQTLHVSASIGIARYTGHMESAEALVGRANKSMHMIRKSLRNGVDQLSFN